MSYRYGTSRSAARTARAEAILEDINAADAELAKLWAQRIIKAEKVAQLRRARQIAKLERERAAIAKATREHEAACAEQAAGRTLRWRAEHNPYVPYVAPSATGNIRELADEAHGWVGSHAKAAA